MLTKHTFCIIKIKRTKVLIGGFLLDYKLLYAGWYGGQRKVIVFNFKRGMTIELTIDELENEELDLKLKEYIIQIKDQIDTGYWDYQE